MNITKQMFFQFTAAYRKYWIYHSEEVNFKFQLIEELVVPTK